MPLRREFKLCATILKKKTLIPVLFTIGIVLSGCGGKKQTEVMDDSLQTEATAAVPIQQQLQRETEQATEEQAVQPDTEETEASTEKKVTAENLKSDYVDAGKAGRLQYEIVTNQETQTGSASFRTSNGVYEYTTDSNVAAYICDDDSYYKAESWDECQLRYADFFQPFFNTASSFEETELDGSKYYKVSVSSADQTSGEAMAPLLKYGYTDLSVSSAKTVYYLSEDSVLKRIDCSIAFTGTSGGVETTGTLNAVYYVDSGLEDDIEVPDNILEDVYPDYTQGELSDTSYSNSSFGFQIVGKEFLTFDLDKTQAMNDNYKNLGTNYLCEAVGNCENGIISITSIKNTGDQENGAALNKYLEDCGAKDAGTIENADFDGITSIKCKAVINNTDTVTYAMSSGSRILFVTIYYKAEDTIRAILDHVYLSWEDPNWTAENWNLESLYEITTPKNFSISQADSSDIYLCMQKGTTEVNVFALNNTDVAAQAAKDQVPAEGEQIQLVSQDVLQSNKGEMQYLILQEDANGATYYTYEALLQMDTNVLKYFVVDVDGDKNYSDLFISLAENTSSITEETETEVAKTEVTTEPAEN